jgi:hypothetical protein
MSFVNRADIINSFKHLNRSLQIKSIILEGSLGSMLTEITYRPTKATVKETPSLFFLINLSQHPYQTYAILMHLLILEFLS